MQVLLVGVERSEGIASMLEKMGFEVSSVVNFRTLGSAKVTAAVDDEEEYLVELKAIDLHLPDFQIALFGQEPYGKYETWQIVPTLVKQNIVCFGVTDGSAQHTTPKQFASRFREAGARGVIRDGELVAILQRCGRLRQPSIAKLIALLAARCGPASDRA